MQATDGALTQSANFTVEAEAGSIQIWLLPSGNQPVGIDAGLIALTDRGPNGYPLPGRSITFSAIAGSATFSACSTSVCTVTTDQSGNALTSVTPTSVGVITIQAADGNVISTFSFTSVSNTDVMQIATTPIPSTHIGDNSGSFAVNLFHADGITPDVNETVTFTAPPGVILYPCFSNVCAVSTGWSGQAGVAISGNAVGTYTIQAAFGSVTQSVSFTLVPHTLGLKIVSAPTTVPLGTTASTLFSVQLLQDGVTPISNAVIALAAPVGSALLGSCGYLNASCWLVSDANGMVSTAVTPLKPGSITLSALSGTATATTTITATGSAEAINILQQPPATVFVGDTLNFSVQFVAPGGGPLVNDLVKFVIVSGPFGFSDVSTASATRGSDGNGIVSELGTPGAAGTITVLVTDGVVSETFTFTAIARPGVGANPLSIAALNPVTYIMEGVPYVLLLAANVSENSAAAANQTVQWAATPGFVSIATSTVTNSAGATSNQALLGPLSAGTNATATACTAINKQPSVCAEFTGYGVAASALQISIQSGAGQSASGTTPFAPIVVLVQDGAGHPVVAAPVSIYQTVTAYTGSCPDRGRCPAVPALASQASVAVSGLDGTVTIAPLTVAGTSVQTEIAVSAGTVGFATTVLTSQQP